MNILRTLSLSAAIFGLIGTSAALADVDFSGSGMAVTQGGHAYAKVKKADRSGDVLHIEIEFVTDYQGYSGESLYDHIAADAVDDTIFVQAGDETFALLHPEDLPEKLQLTFNYNPDANARVGRWQADFSAPAGEVDTAFLIMPNIAPIPLTIRDR